MISLHDSTSVHAFWFVPVKLNMAGEAGGDWIACVLKQEGEDWKAIYRFRFYRDDKAHDSDDEKSWYTASTENVDDKAPADLVAMVEAIAIIISGGQADLIRRIDIRGNGKLAAQLLAEQDFVSIRAESYDDKEPN